MFFMTFTTSEKCWEVTMTTYYYLLLVISCTQQASLHLKNANNNQPKLEVEWHICSHILHIFGTPGVSQDGHTKRVEQRCCHCRNNNTRAYDVINIYGS